MGTLERSESLTHHIGPNGRISVKTISGLLQIRGVDGEDARLTVTYRICAADQAAAERSLATGRVTVDRGPGSLEVEAPERRLATGIAWLFSGARVSADISLDVPWGTRVRYETMSGNIEAVALVGDQKYRTVSGDIRLWSLGGLVEAGSISGSITLDNGGDVRFKGNTISGGLRVRARRFYGMDVSSTSGSIAVIGAFDPSADCRGESISGSLSLTPLSGLTAELRTVSGSISSEIEQRLDGSRGSWRSVIGDGRPTFRFSSTSGGIRIFAPRPGDEVVAEPSPAPATSSAGKAAPADVSSAVPSGAGSDAASGPTDAASGPADAAPRPGSTAVPGPSAFTGSTPPAPTAPLTPARPESEASGDTWNPEESAEVSPSRERVSDDEELAILQALERGEISVDEAATRLSRAWR